MSDFVLEIGAENIPASYVPPAIEQLRADAAAMLERSRIVYDEIYTTGTPRRLTLIVRGLADAQAAGEEVVTGPPSSRAFGPDGAPTPAAQGFARAQGVDVAKLVRVDTPKGEYLAVRRTLARRKTGAVLQEELPALVTALKFPKSMKWEASGVRFARPLRWMVALHGKSVVRFRVADVESGRVTFGRPWMRGERASIADATAYAAALDSLGIVLDHRQRAASIADQARRAAAADDWRIVEDEDLVEELAFMTEDPRLLTGGFDTRYLDLPQEVIVVAMRSHQRYIAATDAHGQLVPRFFTFTDGPVEGPDEVVRGNERVLRARLEDAEFYWREDVKRGVDGLSAELDRIVFIEGMGTIGQKWRRVLALARAVNEQMPAPHRVDDAILARAAELAKADLASAMIRDGKEFTSLQGVIGSRYALACGEPDAVATAIREHYAPRAATDPLPASMAGRVLGLADRLDTIAGCFLAGLKPTGSQDPYALRRGGNGAVRIAAELPGVHMGPLAGVALNGYAAAIGAAELEARRDGKRAGDDLEEFLRGRVEAYLRDEGIPYDVADAVLAVAWERPGVALSRARDLVRLRGDERFERLITGVKRVGNILPRERRRTGAEWGEIRGGFADGAAFTAERFEDPAEHALLQALRETVSEIGAGDDSRPFVQVLSTLSGLATPIDTYFDRVLVNSTDAAVRDNRLAFLAAAYSLFGRFADFQRLVESGSSPA
ncbi:MAG TPA: glycine--tRNA ligase subunit beta [Candidatus Krumholzibacteria bacterium]